MSNLWQLYGLGSIDEPFLDLIEEKRQQFRELSFTEAMTSIDIDILRQFHCPLGHLEAQLFYDTIFNVDFWKLSRSIQKTGAFQISGGLDPLQLAEYRRVVGLACVDPWTGHDKPNATGFRQDLRHYGGDAVQRYGFLLDPRLTAQIRKGLDMPVPDRGTVFDVMNEIALGWCVGTCVAISNRAAYPRLLNNFPPGWIKRIGTLAPVRP